MIKIDNPETNALFVELAACGFSMDNNKIVNQEYANKSAGPNSRTDLNYIINKLEREAETQSEFEKEKEAKAERVQKYTKQWETGQSVLDYDADALNLYKKQIRFCQLCNLEDAE